MKVLEGFYGQHNFGTKEKETLGLILLGKGLI